MAPARAPLTLRDFLELACESSSDGFRSYPRCLPCDDRGALGPVRLLIEANLRRNPSRSPSSFPESPGALAKISRLSRSLSQRLREGFWRRRENDEDIDVDERDSLGLPSPVVSSCSASESSEYGESDTHLGMEERTVSASASASEFEKKSLSSSTGSPDPTPTQTALPAPPETGRRLALDGEPVGRNLEMEDKQQLSPVSVMDFPFDGDDGEEGSDAGTCSPSFRQCLADLERPKAQLLHKIRRFEGLAQVVDAVDLEARFTTSKSAQSDETHLQSNSSTDSATTTTPRSDEHQSINQEEHEPDEHRLLGRLLKDTPARVITDEISERLLLDYFAEGADRRRRALAGSLVGTVKPLDDRNESALVRAAKEWVQSAGPQWSVGDVLFAGEAALADMELGRRWMCVADEEQDVGAAVEGLVMDGLVAELVSDLAAATVASS